MFRLRAVYSVEKRSWECFREGTKSRPEVVRLTEMQRRSTLPGMNRECAHGVIAYGASGPAGTRVASRTNSAPDVLPKLAAKRSSAADIRP